MITEKELEKFEHFFKPEVSRFLFCAAYSTPCMASDELNDFTILCKEMVPKLIEEIKTQKDTINGLKDAIKFLKFEQDTSDSVIEHLEIEINSLRNQLVELKFLNEGQSKEIKEYHKAIKVMADALKFYTIEEIVKEHGPGTYKTIHRCKQDSGTTANEALNHENVKKVLK